MTQGKKFELPLDYNDVAARISEFRKKHPEGSLQQVSIEFRVVAGVDWVIYTAAAYRSEEDTRPGHGTAWEPIPGKTPYTKDSEVQNAETAAWGRAIVAVLAADTKKGIASTEEIRNRRAADESNQEPVAPSIPQGLIDELASQGRRLGINPAADYLATRGHHASAATTEQAQEYLAELKARPTPEPTQEALA